MRTLSQQELSTVSGGFFFCMKPMKKPTCVKLPKPTKHSCKPKPVCGTPPVIVDPPPVGEG